MPVSYRRGRTWTLSRLQPICDASSFFAEGFSTWSTRHQLLYRNTTSCLRKNVGVYEVMYKNREVLGEEKVTW